MYLVQWGNSLQLYQNVIVSLANVRRKFAKQFSEK